MRTCKCGNRCAFRKPMCVHCLAEKLVDLHRLKWRLTYSLSVWDHREGRHTRINPDEPASRFVDRATRQEPLPFYVTPDNDE